MSGSSASSRCCGCGTRSTGVPRGGQNVWLGVELRRLLAKHIFKRCGENFKAFQFVEFSFGYNMEVGDNVVVHRNVLLDDRGGIVLGNSVSISDYANMYSHTHSIVDQKRRDERHHGDRRRRADHLSRDGSGGRSRARARHGGRHGGGDEGRASVSRLRRDSCEERARQAECAERRPTTFCERAAIGNGPRESRRLACSADAADDQQTLYWEMRGLAPLAWAVRPVAEIADLACQRFSRSTPTKLLLHSKYPVNPRSSVLRRH